MYTWYPCFNVLKVLGVYFVAVAVFFFKIAFVVGVFVLLIGVAH